MGKGLSQLQLAILEVLETFPVINEVELVPGQEIDQSQWARPKDIIAALDRTNHPANRVAISKALERLRCRGLVLKGYGLLWAQGKSGRYAKVLR